MNRDGIHRFVDQHLLRSWRWQVAFATIVLVSMSCVLGVLLYVFTPTGKTTFEFAVEMFSKLPLAKLGQQVVKFVLFGVVISGITNYFAKHRENIRSGRVDYVFSSRYVLIVGWDFQVKNLLRKILSDENYKDDRVLLITNSPVQGITDELVVERDRLFVMRKDISRAATYARLSLTGAHEIYVIGDGESNVRDEQVLQAVEELTNKAKSEVADRENSEKSIADTKPIKMYLHIEDSALYSQMRAIALPPDESKLFDLDVYNYYESWAWECWSRKEAKDSMGASYLPLRHRSGMDRTELFVIGAGRMGRAMVNFALPLLNYGETEKKCRVTIFDVDPFKKVFLPDKETLEALPETEVRYLSIDGCSDEANEIMLSAAKRTDTSVTIVIALSDPSAAIRAYSELSNRVRRCPVSVLVWQATHSKDCLTKKYLRMGGEKSQADKVELRYFGMTDILPWQNTARFEYGKAVDFYYDRYVEWAEPRSRVRPNLPRANDPSFPSHAVQIWDGDAATTSWLGKKRWKKWSSINSGDTFREKSQLFDKSDYPASANRILRAEHNRWWTERLLAGWTCAPKRNNSTLEHWDMIPFEDLLDDTKEIDKINIAAMAHFGFVG